MILSIVIPVYNVDNFLRECLDSIVSQIDSMDIEIILINDGSKDKSLSICHEYTSKYANTIVISQENKGASAARNEGLNVAKGKYIWFIDADDFIPYKSISDILLSIEKDKNTDIFCFNHSVLNNDGLSNCILFKEGISMNGLGYLKLHTSMYLWDKIFKKSAIGNVRFLDGIRNTEDMLFTLQVMLKARKVQICSDNIYVYNQTNPNSTLSNRKLSSLLKNSFDTMIVHNKLVDIIHEEKESDVKKVLYDIVNFGVCGHLYALFVDRLPSEHIKEIVKQYRTLNLYPIQNSYNAKGNIFNLLANREKLLLVIISLLRKIKGGNYTLD